MSAQHSLADKATVVPDASNGWLRVDEPDPLGEIDNVPDAAREGSAAIQRFVVGVDGSDGSLKALEWAISEAVRAPASLELVTAWMFPMALGYAFAETPKEVREQAQQIADQSASHAATIAPEVVVRSTLREAEAGPALVELSAGADLLVVGSRGHGALRELLLGSVSAYCARHAQSSIVIVR